MNLLKNLRGKTIAIVYIFEKEDAAGFGHFLVWKDKILTGWLNAVYELECLPYIIDVRTFMQKASNYSLPHIDYVINLNSGCDELSTMGQYHQYVVSSIYHAFLVMPPLYFRLKIRRFQTMLQLAILYKPQSFLM